MFTKETICVNDQTNHGLRRLYIVSPREININQYTANLPEDGTTIFTFRRTGPDGVTTYHLWVLWRDIPGQPLHRDLKPDQTIDWRGYEKSFYKPHHPKPAKLDEPPKRAKKGDQDQKSVSDYFGQILT